MEKKIIVIDGFKAIVLFNEACCMIMCYLAYMQSVQYQLSTSIWLVVWYLLHLIGYVFETKISEEHGNKQ